jgi:hypothetical protein
MSHKEDFEIWVALDEDGAKAAAFEKGDLDLSDMSPVCRVFRIDVSATLPEAEVVGVDISDEAEETTQVAAG